MRKQVRKVSKVHHKATVYSDDFDRQIDSDMRNRLIKEKHIVLESWLSGFVARDLKNVFRILLICSDEALKIDRVVNRDTVTVEEAKIFIKEREEENFKKWKRLYGDYNFFDPKYYQLVIDTYKTGPMETLGKVLDKLGFKQK